MQNFRKGALGKREVRQSRAVIGGNYDNSIPRARALVHAYVGVRVRVRGQVHEPPLVGQEENRAVGSPTSGLY